MQQPRARGGELRRRGQRPGQELVRRPVEGDPPTDQRRSRGGRRAGSARAGARPAARSAQRPRSGAAAARSAHRRPPGRAARWARRARPAAAGRPAPPPARPAAARRRRARPWHGRAGGRSPAPAPPPRPPRAIDPAGFTAVLQREGQLRPDASPSRPGSRDPGTACRPRRPASPGPCSRVSSPATVTRPASSPPWKCGHESAGRSQQRRLPEPEAPARTTISPGSIDQRHVGQRRHRLRARVAVADPVELEHAHRSIPRRSANGSRAQRASGQGERDHAGARGRMPASDRPRTAPGRRSAPRRRGR